MSSQPPPSAQLVVDAAIMSRDELRSIAKEQKYLLNSLLFYIVSWIAMIAVLFSNERSQLSPFMGGLIIVLIVLMVVATVCATVFLFRLAMRLYGVGTGVFLALMTILPCIGLMVLLGINSKATTKLKLNGIKVGFMGADVSAI